MPRVVHFEAYADDVERASKFYSNVFGWNFDKWEGPQDYWLIMTGEEGQPGINGGMMQRPDPAAVGANIVDVPSADGYTNKIVSNGGSVLMPKMSIIGVGYCAYFKDTEGNVFGVIEADASAE
jgi:predicted enzyme related to lactoylglutathione lyase